MSKPTVRYTGAVVEWWTGGAILTPIDHPDGLNVSNTQPVTTSKVISWDEATGRIETKNTIYVPEVA